MRWTLLVLHQMRLYSSCCCPSSTAHQPSSLVQRSPRQHMWNSHCPFVDGAAGANTNAVSPTEIWSKDSCHLGPGHLVGLSGRFAVLIWFLHFTVNFGNAVFVWRTLHITVTRHRKGACQCFPFFLECSRRVLHWSGQISLYGSYAVIQVDVSS